MEAAIRRILSSHFFEGALLIVFGLIMLLFPAPSITVIGIITGAVLLILGATLTVFYIINSKARHTLELFAGLIFLLTNDQFRYMLLPAPGRRRLQLCAAPCWSYRAGGAR